MTTNIFDFHNGKSLEVIIFLRPKTFPCDSYGTNYFVFCILVLEEFTSYSIKIQAVNYVGIGNSSAPVLAQTTRTEPSHDKISNAGATAGAVIGAILFVILVLIVLFILRRKILKRRHNEAVTVRKNFMCLIIIE
jgi:hypothetical protein